MHYIAKEFEFDAAHRLYEYEGKCANIHGHRYKAEIMIKGKELTYQGILIDFGDLKTIIGKWIDDNWDHALLLNSLDKLLQGLCDDTKHYMFMDINPTAEAMAKELYEIADRDFPDQIAQVTIWETPTSRAIYRG